MATSGPPTKTPAEVPPGPGSTGKIPTTPVPIGPPETAPPPVPPGPGSGVVSDPDETPTLPTEELPVEAPVDGPVNIIPSSTAVFVKTELDNVTVIEKTTALNFSGNGVTVIGSGSQANIVITAGSGGNPGGSNTQLQFNDAGVLAGNASLTFNKVTALLSTTNISANNANISSNLSASGNVTGSYFIGNGSLLTGIAANYGNANVAANLAAFGSNPILTTGNVTAGNFVGGGAGTPTISLATNLDLSAVSAVRVIGGGTFRLPSLTTAQIANTIAANGDMIYNSSVNKFQGYENGAWANII